MHRACLVILVLLLTHTAHAGWKTPFGTLFNSKPDTSFKYYVADVRDRPWDVKYRTTNIEDSLLSRLECRGPAIDESLELYDSNYNLIDQWFLVNLLNSPLRVDDPSKADAVFIPTRYNFRNHDAYKQFLDNSSISLPLLGKLPHFVVLGAPRQAHIIEEDPLVTHPVAKEHFIYLTMVGADFFGNQVRDLSTFITVPYFHQVHWTQGSMKQHRIFNARSVMSSKRHWAAHAYAVRPVYHPVGENAVHSRVYLYEQCVAAGKPACTFTKAETGDWAAVFRASAASLFTAQPRGDWVSRCSISDVLAAGSIPLVPLDDYGHFMPFTDVLDWRAYTEVLTEDEVASTPCTCTHANKERHQRKPTARVLLASAPVPAPNSTMSNETQYAPAPAPNNTTSNTTETLPASSPTPTNIPVPLQRDDFANATFSEQIHDRKVECRCEGPHHVQKLQARYSNSKMAVLHKLHAVYKVRQVYQYSWEPDWSAVKWEDVGHLTPTDDALTFSLKALMRRLCLLGLSDKCPTGMHNPAGQLDVVVDGGVVVEEQHPVQVEWLSKRNSHAAADARRLKHRVL